MLTISVDPHLKYRYLCIYIANICVKFFKTAPLSCEQEERQF